MLDLETLRHFLAIATHGTLAAAATHLHLTPGALSKSLKRLEEQLQVTLFDRDGRTLRLNLNGERLRPRAAALLAQARQLQFDFAGEKHAFACRIAAPSLLHVHWAETLATRVAQAYPKAAVGIQQMSEAQALRALVNGGADVALVTAGVLEGLDTRLESRALGDTEFRVAIGAAHPLHAARFPGGAAIEEVIAHAFATLLTPPFAQLETGVSSDGWHDERFPRIVRYRSDDLALLGKLVRTGQALAYLPDRLIRDLGLDILPVSGCPYFCRQRVVLVFDRAHVPGWVGQAVNGSPWPPLEDARA